MATLQDLHLDNDEILKRIEDRLTPHHHLFLRCLGGELGNEIEKTGGEMPDVSGWPRVGRLIRRIIGKNDNSRAVLQHLLRDLWTLGLVKSHDLREYKAVSESKEGKIRVEPTLTSLGRHVLHRNEQPNG